MNSRLRGLVSLIIGLYILESLGLLIILSLFRIAQYADGLSFLSSLGGKLFLVASTLFMFTTLLVGQNYHAMRRIGIRPFKFVLKWNIVPTIFFVLSAEGTLRLFLTAPLPGTMVEEKLFPPNNMYSYDELLGWTIRQNLSGTDGMYFSSPHGIRSAGPGIAFGDSGPACRIALVGDSHTFGLELKYEDTWPYHLERDLPSGCQVLNFGVPAYSVGQIYLKYLRDVHPWHPDVLIVALSSNTARRTMGVYGFNMLSWTLFPGAQPRFQIKDNKPIPINVPLPTLEDIASTRMVRDLPFIEYDWNFKPDQWDLIQWRYLYQSYLFRLYVTWYPLWAIAKKGDSLESLNHELLRSLVRTIKLEGTTPMVIYLPDTNDRQESDETITLGVLRTSGVEYLNLIPCLDAVPANIRFIPHGSHYSASGSMVIARCIASVVIQKGLNQRPVESH